MNYKQLPEVSVDIKTTFVRPEIRSGRPFKIYAQYPFLGDRGYFSTGGDFNLKTAFYGLLPLCMNYKQLPEVYADVRTIFVRPEIRSGRPFKVYAHYSFLGGRSYFSSGGDFDLKTAFYGLLPVYMNDKQLPEVSVDIKTIFVRPEIRSGRPFKVYAQYPFLGDRGYFSTGGDFNLKTAFYGLLPLCMNYKQLPEVYADVRTIFVRPEIRSGRPFKVYAHYPFLGDRGYFGSCIMAATL